MLSVISPAKTFGQVECATATYTQPVFLKETNKLIRQLKQMTANDIADLMNVSAKIAHLNVERYKQWKRTPTANTAQQALAVFQGDVYRSLDISSMNKKDLEFSQNHLRILSGLYGLLRPLDLIQAYRLEMGTRMKNVGSNNLYQFWGDKITEALNEAFKNKKSAVLVNLASNEYFNAVNPEQLKAKIITPAFKEKRNGNYKVIGISAKRARGAMARYIIKNRLRKVDAIKEFDVDGYLYRKDLSDDKQWVFARG